MYFPVTFLTEPQVEGFVPPVLIVHEPVVGVELIAGMLVRLAAENVGVPYPVSYTHLRAHET